MRRKIKLGSFCPIAILFYYCYYFNFYFCHRNFLNQVKKLITKNKEKTLIKLRPIKY